MHSTLFEVVFFVVKNVPKLYVTRSGPLRPKSIFFKIELLTESVKTHFKKYFGPNPSFIAHSWTKLWFFEVNMAQESEVQ